jgi:carboxymethylenebutenolidase
VVHLISQSQLSPKVKAAVVAHPSFLDKDEAGQIKRPILFQCAQNDDIFKPELREHFQKELAKTGLAKFIDYPGTAHGFAVRPDGSPKSEEQHVKAMHDAVEYLQKNV